MAFSLFSPDGSADALSVISLLLYWHRIHGMNRFFVRKTWPAQFYVQKFQHPAERMPALNTWYVIHTQGLPIYNLDIPLYTPNISPMDAGGSTLLGLQLVAWELAESLKSACLVLHWGMWFYRGCIGLYGVI